MSTDELAPHPPETVRGREAYDALVAAADTTLVVVTASYRGERGGCLVGFHCQCSIEPARHAVWLSKANHTCRVALQASHLGVHFLGPADRALARRFGERTGDEEDKFAGCDTVAGPHGVPVLRGIPNRMIGQRRTSIDDGSDHVCFVVEPLDAWVGATPIVPMRLSAASDLEPGHAAEERARET